MEEKKLAGMWFFSRLQTVASGRPFLVTPKTLEVTRGAFRLGSVVPEGLQEERFLPCWRLT